MQIKEISPETISRIREVISKYRNGELISYVPLSGAIATILEKEIKDRQFLEFAIENHTRILEFINANSDYIAIKKNGKGEIHFEADGKKVDVFGN
jgi:hypothetical protein